MVAVSKHAAVDRYPVPSGERDRPMLGIGLMVTGMLIVPLLDLCAKLLAADYSVLQVSWARFAFHFLFLLPIVSWRRLAWWRVPPLPGFQIARSVCLLGATVSFFLAIRENPIPVALALLFVSPLLVTLLAPLLLGEPFHPARLMAAGVGFIGVLVVLRPSGADFAPSVLFALLAGFAYALYIMTTRRVSGLAPPLLTLFYTAIAGLLVMSLIMPWVWRWPDLAAWGLMALMGFFAATGHFMIIKACEFASASLLAPFNYTELIGATTVSYLWFGYFPDTWVWVGVAIVCGSGLYLSLQELRRPKRSPESVNV
jgi:drug/metabolite transporter (DMT)-like permease